MARLLISLARPRKPAASGMPGASAPIDMETKGVALGHGLENIDQVSGKGWVSMRQHRCPVGQPAGMWITWLRNALHPLECLRTSRRRCCTPCWTNPMRGDETASAPRTASGQARTALVKGVQRLRRPRAHAQDVGNTTCKPWRDDDALQPSHRQLNTPDDRWRVEQCRRGRCVQQAQKRAWRTQQRRRFTRAHVGQGERRGVCRARRLRAVQPAGRPASANQPRSALAVAFAWSTGSSSRSPNRPTIPPPARRRCAPAARRCHRLATARARRRRCGRPTARVRRPGPRR